MTDQATQNIPVTYIRTKPHIKDAKVLEKREKFGFLSPADIDKIPIPTLRDVRGATIPDWIHFPKGWTVTPDIDHWTEFEPFETEWGLIKDPRLIYDPDEKNEVRAIDNDLHSWCFYNPKVKKEDDWNKEAEPVKPPYERIEGDWVNVLTLKNLQDKRLTKPGTIISFPYNLPLREWNQTYQTANTFQKLLEQSCIYYASKYDFLWRKAIMDEEAETFFAYEMEALQRAYQPIVEEATITNGEISELVVRFDDKATSQVKKKMDRIADYVISSGINDPRPQKSVTPKTKPLYNWPEAIYFTIQNRIHTEEAFKLMARYLKHLYERDEDPSNPWAIRMKAQGPKVFTFRPPNQAEDDEEIRNWKQGKENPKARDWKEMKEDLRRRAKEGEFSRPLMITQVPYQEREPTSCQRRNRPPPQERERVPVDPIDPGQTLSEHSIGHKGRRAPPPSIRAEEDPSDSSSSSSDDEGGFRGPPGFGGRRREENRRRPPGRTGGRGITPLQHNEWLFPPPPPPPRHGRERLHDPVIDENFKIDNLPKFDGSDGKLVSYIFDANEIAEQGHAVWQRLGRTLPMKFEKKAQNWWRAKDPAERREIGESWDTLRLAICEHWMTQIWRANEKIRCNKIKFQSEGHSKEGPMAYFYRKLQAIRVSYYDMGEFDIVREILEGAPESWQKYFTIQINTLQELGDQVQQNKHLFKQESDVHKNVEILMEEFNRRKTPRNGNNWSNQATTNTAKPFVKAKAHVADSKPKGFHPSFEQREKFPRRDDVVSRGKTPEQKNARPCIHCDSPKHWDKDCPYSRNKKVARVHFVGANEDVIQAMDEYYEAQLTSGGEEDTLINGNEDKESSEDSGNEESSD
jgi:hypothetical protein